MHARTRCAVYNIYVLYRTCSQATTNHDKSPCFSFKLVLLFLNIGMVSYIYTYILPNDRIEVTNLNIV